jgi:AraC-like DNA-binding protein
VRLESFAAIRLPNQSARIMRLVVESAGLPWTPLLDKAGIPQDVLDDPNGVVSGAQEVRLQEAFVRATGHIPGVWFAMGRHYRLMTYGPLGLAVLAAGTFGAGLRLLMSFTALTYSLMRYTLEEDGGELLAITADDAEVPPSCRVFSQERALAAVTQILTDMNPTLSAIARIETVLDPEDGRRDFERALGVPLVFGAPVTRWVFRPGIAAAPLPMASPMLEEVYGKLCERLIDEARVRDEVVSRVYALLVRASPRFPTAAEASRSMGLSERSLFRKLASHGLTFHRMVSQVQEQQAVEFLGKTRMPIEAVASAVGFAETASFSRAFKRWRGVAPLQFRTRLGRP